MELKSWPPLYSDTTGRAINLKAVIYSFRLFSTSLFTQTPDAEELLTHHFSELPINEYLFNATFENSLYEWKTSVLYSLGGGGEPTNVIRISRN